MPVATRHARTIDQILFAPPPTDTRIPYVHQRGPNSPFAWWRTCKPIEFDPKDSTTLRRILRGTKMADEPNWPRAIAGQVTTAIWIAVDRLKKRQIAHLEIDLALSALLACAIDGDVTAEILISSALRRRGNIEPACRDLADLWLISDFSHNIGGGHVN